MPLPQLTWVLLPLLFVGDDEVVSCGLFALLPVRDDEVVTSVVPTIDVSILAGIVFSVRDDEVVTPMVSVPTIDVSILVGVGFSLLLL